MCVLDDTLLLRHRWGTYGVYSVLDLRFTNYLVKGELGFLYVHQPDLFIMNCPLSLSVVLTVNCFSLRPWVMGFRGCIPGK